MISVIKAVIPNLLLFKFKYTNFRNKNTNTRSIIYILEILGLINKNHQDCFIVQTNEDVQ